MSLTEPGGEARRGSLFADLNSAAFWAGISTFIFITFGALTLQLSVIKQFELPTAQAESWITVTWLTTAAVSLILSIHYRAPIAIAWFIPVLIFMGGLAERFSFEEFAGASLVAGVLIMIVGVLRLGRHVLVLLPLPILMGMFAASLLGFITRMIEATADDIVLVGPMVVAYVLGRFLNNQRIPPVGLAVVIGAVMVLALGEAATPALEAGAPRLTVPQFSFSLEAIFTVSIPMVVLAFGLGNAPSLAFLASQTYRVSADGASIWSGIASVVNAIFGGHPASMVPIVTMLMGGPEAGALEKRYWAAIVAFIPVIGIGLSAALIVSVITVLPPVYIAAVAGLAILSSLEDALAKAFGSRLRFGATVAFCVTLSTFEVAGLPPALWALIAGLAASLITERQQFLSHWREAAQNSHHEFPAKTETATVSP